MRTPALLACITLSAPLAAQCDQLTLSSEFLPATWDTYGSALDSHEGLLAVGVPAHDQGQGDLGALYLIRRTAIGWGQAEVLVADDAQQHDRLGQAVAVWGDTAIVASDLARAAYVFELHPSGWTQTAKLESDIMNWSKFGEAVALHKDTLWVGASGEANFKGRVYVFERSGSTWTLVQKLMVSDAGVYAFFGRKIAVFGDVGLVSADLDDGSGVVRPMVVAFERGPGGWVEVQRFHGDDGECSLSFGTSIDVQGDRAIIGAQLDSCLGYKVGAAYVFERGALGWEQSARLSPSNPIDQMEFGNAVVIDADRALIGAWLWDLTGSNINWGGAYLFQESPSGWVQSSFLHLDDPIEFDEVGATVALAGDWAMVGAPSRGETNDGAVYAYRLPAFTYAYCHCDHAAPCDNGAPLTGCRNSTGAGASLEACGSGSVATDDLVVSVGGAASQQFGLLFMGAAPLNAIPFGAGQRCVGAGGAGIFRFPVRQSDAAGVVVYGPGLVAHSHSSFATEGHIDAGETWYFQFWYRDHAGPCDVFNTSNAVAATFGL